MKRALWLTDIHLNFLTDDQVDEFLSAVNEERADVVLIGGDIAESHDVARYLEWIDHSIEAPVYFVLGNHDYYHGSIREVRARVAQCAAQSRHLHYLTVSP